LLIHRALIYCVQNSFWANRPSVDARFDVFLEHVPAEILLPSCLICFHGVLNTIKQDQRSAICLKSGEMIIAITFAARGLTPPSMVVVRLQWII
jgi:hypothetical protein